MNKDIYTSIEDSQGFNFSFNEDNCVTFTKCAGESGPINCIYGFQKAKASVLASSAELASRLGKNAEFEVSDMSGKVLSSGYVTKGGKICYFTDVQPETPATEIRQDEAPEDAALAVEQEYSPMVCEEITCASEDKSSLHENDQIVQKTKPFVDKCILSQSDVDFLTLPLAEVEALAFDIQEALENNKQADTKSLAALIQNVSKGLIPISTKLRSGERVREGCVSINLWVPYCFSHWQVSLPSILEGNRDYRKVRGIVRVQNLAERILETYEKCRALFIGSDITSFNEDNSTECSTPQQELGNSIIEKICSTIMVYTNQDCDLRTYLKVRGLSIASEIESATNGVLSGTIDDDTVTISSAMGRTASISTSLPLSDLRQEVMKAVSRLLISSAISPKTRDLLASVVDFDSIEELQYCIAA